MATYVQPVNLTGPVEILRYANTAADGWFGSFIALAVFLIVFLMLKESYPVSKGFATASFICAIASVFLWAMGVMDGSHVFIPIAMSVIGYIWLSKSEY